MRKRTYAVKKSSFNFGPSQLTCAYLGNYVTVAALLDLLKFIANLFGGIMISGGIMLIDVTCSQCNTS